MIKRVEVRKITAKEAEQIMLRMGDAFGDDGTTFYAYSKWSDGTESIYDFDTKRDRDFYVAECQKQERA